MGKVIDLSGKRFGMLTVIKRGCDRYGKTGRKFITWDCVCDCGNIITVDGNNLRTGNTQSCGCEKPIIDISGMKFGKLTVIEESGRCKNGGVKWKCVCECGKTTNVDGYNLRYGVTKSCGCGMIKGLEIGWSHKTHGESQTRLYNIWCGIKNRTSKSTDAKHKKDYYDRGIRICKEWEHSFETFRDWALSHGYKDNLTIDRIDNDGNYCPENCRWTTNYVQSNNRRSNRNYTFNGKTQNISQWARELDISEDMLRDRLVILGWSVEDALLKPSQRRQQTEQQKKLYASVYGEVV